MTAVGLFALLARHYHLPCPPKRCRVANIGCILHVHDEIIDSDAYLQVVLRFFGGR